MGAQRDRSRAALILAAGEIRDYQALAVGLPPGLFVVCADAGLCHCAPLGLRPDLLVGDFDSHAGPFPEGVERISLSPDKNYTDTHHAVEAAVERGFHSLILAGMLGGARPEHALANLQTLLWCARQGLDAVLRDGVSEMMPLWGQNVQLPLPCREACYFSLLAMEPCKGVTILGGKYPLNNYPLSPTDPRAVSNEFAGQDVCIHIERGALLVVCTPMCSEPVTDLQ